MKRKGEFLLHNENFADRETNKTTQTKSARQYTETISNHRQDKSNINYNINVILLNVSIDYNM